MPEFQFTAADANDRPENGTIEAASADEARELLEERGLRDVLIFVDAQAIDEELLVEEEPVLQAADDDESAEPATKKPSRLRSLDADVLATIRDAAASGVPLSAGLRALSEEVPSRRLRTGFRSIAQRIEEGESLHDAIAAQGSMPAWLKGIVHAGNRLGSLPTALDHCVRFSRLRVIQRNRILASLIYPAALFLVLFGVIGFVLVWIVPEFKSIFEGFGTELPRITEATLAFSDILVFFLRYWYVSVVLIVLVWFAFRTIAHHVLGAAAIRRGIYLIPYFGPMFRNGSLAEFCHLMAILIENRLPLSESLELASQGVQDPNISEGARMAGELVESGTALDRAAAQLPHFPRELVYVLSWERRDGSLPAALRGAGDLYSAQTSVSARTMMAVIEPAMVLFLGMSAGLIVISLFMPLVKLLNDLS